MSESRYPVSTSFKVLEGHDIYRSNNLIVALVAVESQYGRDLRLYRWIKRNDQWKVDLCRMGVGRWDWDEVATRVKDLMKRHGIRPGTQAEESAPE